MSLVSWKVQAVLLQIHNSEKAVKKSRIDKSKSSLPNTRVGIDATYRSLSQLGCLAILFSI
jgi:hypothetical protein